MSSPHKEETNQQPQETQQPEEMQLKQKEQPQEEKKQEQEQELEQSEEKQTQYTEMEEVDTKETEETKEDEEETKEEEKNEENTTEETKQLEEKKEEVEKEEKAKEKESEETTEKNEEQKQMKTPVKAATPVAKKTPSQAASASKSAAKRKLEEPSTSDHDKTKKARASVPAKPNGSANKVTKPREFSFARPTASSARRTAAVAADHANAKAKPTPPPARKPIHAKHTPAKVQRASMPAPKTPTMTGADKASRPHFNYTPYTGPLPPLTVESSFAPKNSYVLDRGARTASPAKTTARKSRPASVKKAQSQSSTGKENNGVNTDGGAATNGASSSKNHRTPIKSSIGSVVSKEETHSAFKKKIKSQRALAQQTARSSPTATEDPTA